MVRMLKFCMLKYSTAVLFILAAVSSAQENPALQRAPYVKILSSDENSLVLEFNLPGFEIMDTDRHAQFYQIISVPGFSQTAGPGAPQLPVTAVSFGLPPDARPSLRVLDKHTGYIPEASISPAADIRLPQSDTPWLPEVDVQPEYVYETGSVYSENAFTPPESFQLNDPVIMRGRNMASVRILPFQYNPVTKQVNITHYAKIEILYNSGLGKRLPPSAAAPADTFFNSLYRNTLINYEQAKRFPKQPRALRKQAAGDHFLDQGSQWLKLEVDHPAMYWLEKSDLDAVGFDMTGKDPRRLKLFNKGEECAIYVHGQDDGSFDSGDYIEFYGDSHETYYSNSNIYWLTVSTTNGSRMSNKDGSLSQSVDIVTRGKERVRFKESLFYLTNFENSINEDRWRWGFVISGYSSYETWSANVEINNVADTVASDCYFKSWVKGGSDTDEDPDHHVIISMFPQADLNDSTTVLDYQFDGELMSIRETSIDQSTLNNGSIQVKYFGPGDTGASLDRFYIMKFEIEYWQDFIALQDSLSFNAKAGGLCEIHVHGFNNSSLLVYDISDSTAPQRILNTVSSLQGADYMLAFQDDVTGGRRYTAITPGHRVKPDSIYLDDSTNWRQSNITSDYVIIVYDEFFEGVTEFSQFKEQEGYRVHTVKIQDIYDEFNYGLYSDIPIKTFLQHAYDSWNSAPAFVLFVGDASYNPRINNPAVYGYERSDFVPTHLFTTIYKDFESPTDQWFACVDGGDIIPDMYVGRVNPRSLNETRGIMDKLIGYQTGHTDTAWRSRLIFAADRDETEFDFTGNSDELIDNNIPDMYSTKRIYLADYANGAQAKDTLLHYWDQGALFVNYQGHGSNQRWSGENLLDRSDIPGMRNSVGLPVVLTEACKNGDFVDPKVSNNCLGEFLINERNRGAAGVYTGAGFAFLTPVQTLAHDFYHSVLVNRERIWGQSVMSALQAMYAQHPSYWDHVWFYITFGDPSMALHLPNGQFLVSSQYSGTVSFNETPLPLGTPVSVWNQNILLAETSVVDDSGSIESVSIRQNHPGTPGLDGAQPGDTLIFRAVVNSDTLDLQPPVVWQPNDSQIIAWYAFTTSVEQNEIRGIQVALFSVIAGHKPFISGDVIPADAKFGIQVLAEKELQADDLNLLVDEQQVGYDMQTLSQGRYHLMLETSEFADGVHRLQVLTNLPLPADALTEFDFVKQSECDLKNVMNVPNPMSEKTEFTFELYNDKAAQITLRIYTVSGRQIRTLQPGLMDVGFNSLHWNGLDDDGDRLANGLYLYKITAKENNEKAEKIGKLLIAR